MKRITIDPITRLEGHGKIEIFLDEEGEVENAYLQIPELRGFEQFSVGRPAEEAGEGTGGREMTKAQNKGAFGQRLIDSAREAVEIERGKRIGKPREKFISVEEMVSALESCAKA